MSRQNILYRDKVLPDGEILCCDAVGQTGGDCCRDGVFLCRDQVGQGRENLCRDRGQLGHDTDALSRTVGLGRTRQRRACDRSDKLVQ